MAHEQSFARRAASRFSGLLLGGVLALSFYNWYTPGVEPPLKLLPARHGEAPGLEDTPHAFSNATLMRRDAYSCAPGKPCSNGACCGGSGYCGYGPTYCVSGCVSNCDAMAECGQYAKVSGTECPLNTCCSKYGFCGTTELFCTGGCQSNCILKPSPPGSGSRTPILQSRVIGYYESWSARKTCHQVAPTKLPLDALTHVNFAFAYIDPGSFKILTMDTSTPSSLFQDTANLKSVKPDLKIFISVGGWSFSDNGTVTQALYSEIAADAGKRQTFTNNVVHFMRQYGFDGLDIDWEYPGATDRGGSKADTANFVALLQNLRQTFDAGGNHFGLTFTAPSSYWYLRWFDLPNLIKYADWINLMTYDLHGVWDAANPIGSIVQGHTNLTEIKLAAELFWRVNIPPSKLVMGFGFYGRSFTLADPSCNTPGCPFSGASNPGPCTGTGGILSYYEIMDVLHSGSSTKRDTSIKPTHDRTDAVNYFTFNNNQWVSYDNAVTFKQKTDWADSVGLGGALIWASDLDDDKYTAHSGLLGRTVLSTSSLQTVDKALSNPQSVIQNLAGSNGQHCFAYQGKCVNLNDNNAMQAACGSGFTVVGWDDAGCGKKKCHCGKPICCPTNEAPNNCIWRGDNNGQGTASDCSAQCLPGETNIKGIGSSWGGGFLNDGNTNRCGRGFKVFCCPNPDAGQVTQGCSYAACRANCPSGSTPVLSKVDNCWFGAQQYCCSDPVELMACHWVYGSGTGECANAVCNSIELEVDTATYGGPDGVGCSWRRKVAACCTVQTATPPPSTCSADLCKLGLCSNDGDPGGAISRRGLARIGSASSEHVHLLQERDESGTYIAILPNGFSLVIIAAIYPAIGRLYEVRGAGQVLRRLFRLIPGRCIGPAVNVAIVAPGSNPPGLGGMQTEHPVDRQIAARFIEAASSGLLRNRIPTHLPGIGSNFFQNYWDHPLHGLANAPAVGGPMGAKPLTPNDRMMEAFGSDDYPYPLLPTDQQINGPKGNLMNLNAPADLAGIRRLALAAVQQDTPQAADTLLSEVRVIFAIFEYMNNNDFATRFNAVLNQVRTQLGHIEQASGVQNLQSWWDVFTNDYFSQIEEWAQSWADQAIVAAAAPYLGARNSGRNPRTYNQVMGTLQQWQQLLAIVLRFPIYGSIPLPQPPGSSSP